MARKKMETFALVPKHGWFVVDRVSGTPSDGRPYFIGPGIGFDINRLLVYARNESDAAEVAEEKWPDRMGTKVSKRDEDDAGDVFYHSSGRVYAPKEVRILTVASRVEKGTPELGSEAVLKSGETIRYT